MISVKIFKLKLLLNLFVNFFPPNFLVLKIFASRNIKRDTLISQTMADEEEFEIPLNAQDLSSRSTKGSYHVESETNVENHSEGQLNKIVDQLAAKLRKNAALSITEHAQFDLMWSLLT